ncbi:uncharacterized protein UMAG_15081 [Mycosarcoma maydis]|uniref:Uncharacterized protein n=1 Tax=Mycosarcoma maydis TaxID=5270 RepID=A0A0D1CN68_MYCMD|nr:uncharacterized protein UMAG_15081 [Ustilago maydis 521]KIS68068.1 hypothetical protein UMAG_15081 [Ustilago maydis 521]|eukprot:XP_011390361.1 hypothetical protein UMAG_15081 [Ustilago maydis 521]
MPRFRTRPSRKTRSSSGSKKKRDKAQSSAKQGIDGDVRLASKGKQREIGMSNLVARAEPSDAPFIPGLMLPSSSAVSSATHSPSNIASPTSTAVTNPLATIHHNTPLILCIVIGAVIVTATLSVGLAWILRLACCAGERRARRKRRLDRSTWSPSDHDSMRRRDETEARKSFDSVTVTGDDDLEGKDAKIDSLFRDTTNDSNASHDMPVLNYADAGKPKVQGTPVSTWNGKGWTLFDPPVAPIQAPKPAATGTSAVGIRGGNYGAARQELADQDVGGFTWPCSVERQPSFIERLVQRHHQASDLPTAAPLPYPFQAKPMQPASRMASLGGAANRAVMNMLPVTLRNAATTASRQRATRKRYRDMQPYLDSDLKGIEPSRGSLLSFPVMEGDRRSRLLGNVGRWLGQMTEAGEVADPYTPLSPRPDCRLTKNGSLRSDYTSTTLADSTTASNSGTHVDARTTTSGAGKSERLLERVDADQAEHDRQQRRLLRKARKFTPSVNVNVDVDVNAQPDTARVDSETAVTEEVNVSRAPSIRPQFCATTDLKSWLEPNKMSTMHAFKVLEESDATSSIADPFASDVERRKPKPTVETRCSKKLRSSSSKEQLRTSAKDASRKKRAHARPAHPTAANEAGGEPLASRCQSSAAVTVVSSVFDEAFAAELNKARAAAKKTARASKFNHDAMAKAKAEADVAMREAWRRRRMLSVSSRDSQRSRTTRTNTTRMRSQSPIPSLISRKESVRSQPSVYSELTAPSDYAFQAPLLSESAPSALLTRCGTSVIETMSESQETPRQDEVLINKQLEKQLKRQAKKEAKREQRHAERSQAKQVRASQALPSVEEMPRPDLHQSFSTGLSAAAARDAESVRRVIRKQRSISLGAVRSQLNLNPADLDHINAVPDSPWTSSDSDISIRRWGEPRRDDPVRMQNHRASAARHHHSSSIPNVLTDMAGRRSIRSASQNARSNSYYFGMGAGGDLRDFC